jgi:uncharacterized membrane protein
MSGFLLLKLVHVTAAIVGVGSNLTYAYWLRRAGADRERLIDAIHGIRGLDRRIANPAYVVVLLSGLAMATVGPYTFDATWLRAALGLYVVVVVLGVTMFAPAIRVQLAEAERDPTSDAYRRAARRSNGLGLAVTALVLAILTLMVMKPF